MNLGIERAVQVSVTALILSISILWAPPSIWLAAKMLVLAVLIANSTYIVLIIYSILRSLMPRGFVRV